MKQRSWQGGDGLSWRNRSGRKVWRRLDFLQELPDGGVNYLLARKPLWHRLSKLAYPVPKDFYYRNGYYFTQNPWVDGVIRTHLSALEIWSACAALAPAFASGIWHGDLAAEHLLFAADGSCQWIDWLQSSSAGLPCLRGRTQYLSPERILHGYVTLSSELYALGILLEYWTRENPLLQNKLRGIISSVTDPIPHRRPKSYPEFLRSLAVLLDAVPSPIAADRLAPSCG